MRIYDKILADQGKEAADAYMGSLRSKDKPAGSLHYTEKKRRVEIARNAANARWKNASSPKKTQQESESQS